MKIGFANGVFDLFHDGHKHFLLKAKACCRFLIVAVNTDESVKLLKGEKRPRWPLFCRMSHVRNYADAVIPFDGDPLPLIQGIRPDILFRGEDQNVRADEWGGKTSLVVIRRLPGISTTAILEKELFNLEE